jgi:hypothetical protein
MEKMQHVPFGERSKDLKKPDENMRLAGKPHRFRIQDSQNQMNI